MIHRKKGKGKINSTKHTKDGINFKSSLELKMHTLLKEAGIKAVYEGKKFKLVEPFEYPAECFERTPKTDQELKDKRKIRAMEYTPDFVGPDPDNPEFVIETKGFANESFPLRWKFFKMIETQGGNAPMLFKPSSQADCEQVIKILKEKGYGR